MASATEVWAAALQEVLEVGSREAPRGQPTTEVVAHYCNAMYMSFPVVVSPVRKLGYKFMAAEAAWILSGDDRVETIKPYSKDIANFSDDGLVFFGAYGPKVVKQLPFVVDTLSRDPSSRQAVVSIWRESPPTTKDVPCTLNLQFLVRNGRLHCVANMRSSDLWLGHPYDVFNFSMVAVAVALDLRDRGLNLELGDLHLSAGSKHVYDKNAVDAKAAVDEWRRLVDPEWGPQVELSKFDDRSDLVSFLWELAKSGKTAEDSSWAA